MIPMLIADDNKDITEILANYAKKEDYDPIIAVDGEDAIKKFDEYNPSVVLLDVMMPKIDGYEVCRQIRKKSNVPIILVTARGEDFERIMGLDIGADDYIVKPFSPNEVMARVRAVMRRMVKPSDDNSNILTIADLTINLDEYSMTIGGTPVVLTKKELETMWTLAKSPNRVFSRDVLLNTLWGYDYYGDSRTVDTHIKRLRQKISVVSHPSWDVATVHGVGYKFAIHDQSGKEE